MIKALVSDFARVLLFPKDKTFQGRLNPLHKELSQKPGYNPLDYFELNFQLLDYYASLKSHVPVYIFTSDVIQDAPEFQPFLKPVFKEIFSASKMNTHKSDPKAYAMFAQNLNLQPNEILYIDDSAEYVESAQSAGLDAIQYQNNESVIEKIDQKFEKSPSVS